MEKFLTREHVSESLQVSEGVVDRLIKRGDIKAWKFGGAVRIDADSIHEYLSIRVMGKGIKLKA